MSERFGGEVSEETAYVCVGDSQPTPGHPGLDAPGRVGGDPAMGRYHQLSDTHCALCDITHRGLGRNREWEQILCNMDVPVDVVHLNERTREVTEASAGRTPCVLAHTDAGLVMLLGPDDLEKVGGDVAGIVAGYLSVGTVDGASKCRHCL